MIVINVSFPIEPDRIDEAVDRGEMLVGASNRETGMIEYRATRDVQDDTKLRFLERYEDEATLESHLETDRFGAFEAALPDLLAGEPEVRRFDVAEASDLEL